MTFGVSLWEALQRKLQGGAFIFEGGAGRKIPKDQLKMSNEEEDESLKNPSNDVTETNRRELCGQIPHPDM